MADERPSLLSEEAGRIFYEGIGMVLSGWTEFQDAVDKEWGGRDSRRKAAQLHSDTFYWFTRSPEPLYIDDLEDKLYEGLDSLGVIGNGSGEEVAEKLMIMHEECLAGNFKYIDSLRERMHPRIPVSHVRQANDDDEDEDVDGNEVNMAEDRDSAAVSSVSARGTGGLSVAPLDQSSEDMQGDEPNPQPSAEEQDGCQIKTSR